MQGRLWVESALGQGSSFHFTLCLTSTEDAASTPPVDEISLAGMEVLIVDDNLTNRRILSDLLLQWHARPTLAASAQEGLSLIGPAAEEGRPFTLVLTDSNMPRMDGFELAVQIKRSPHPVPSVILMIDSGQHGNLARCRDLGVSGYVTKPVRQAELKSVIAGVLASLSQTRPVSLENPTAKTAADVFPAALPISRRILLVEDNVVNQRVAVRMLEKEGHQIVVAANGREAVAAWLDRSFEIVLMDMQMPEMDGFEATSEIRRIEAGSNGHIPIVAMTAHAMNGYRERCLAAGMDDYISKPVRKSELMEIIARHTLNASPESKQSPRLEYANIPKTSDAPPAPTAQTLHATGSYQPR